MLWYTGFVFEREIKRRLIMSRFELKLSVHDQFCIEVEDATKEEIKFLKSLVLTQLTDYEEYKIKFNAGPFLQGINEKTGWILIEFWKPDGIDKFMEYVNKNNPS
jgi:hypothetical protein